MFNNPFLIGNGAEQDKTSFFLATVTAVDSSYGVKILPDGQSTAMQKYYKILCNGDPAAVNDRVVVMRQSGTCVVLGKLGTTSSGNTITVDSALDNSSENPVQNKVIQTAISGIQSDVANRVLYYTSQVVTAATEAQIMRIPSSGTDSAITTDTVVLECNFAAPSYIMTDVTWTSYSGYIAFTGTCTAATTANVVLGTKGN